MWVRRISVKLGEVIDVDDAYFENRSKHVNVMNLQNEKVRVNIQYEKLPNYCYWCGLLGHTEKECLVKPLEMDGKTFKDWPFHEHLRASNAREDGIPPY
ncbi:reverse transcriptase, partial [Tanacetum coccineum]